jgi:type III pantothenate kinase
VKPDVVVDIGNSRMKWGRVSGGRVAEVVSFAHEDPVGWKRYCELWGLTDPSRWVLAGVVPSVVRRFEGWLAAHGMDCMTITNNHFTSGIFDDNVLSGFVTVVEEPEKIGIDRLLTAFAAWQRAPLGASAVALNVGTAMTIDFVESSGTHRGGAILPGPRLMARSLHEYTAKLPLVEIVPELPMTIWGENTESAIEHGIANAILGAADQLVWDWATLREEPPAVFATGGDVGYFAGFVFTADVSNFEIDPALTLEGIRLAAEALP